MANVKDFIIKNGLQVDGGTFIVDDTNNRVGIGTTSPDNAKLEIASGTNQIQLNTGNEATYGRLDIGHFTNGTFIGTHAGTNAAANLLRFGISGSTKVTLDSGGLKIDTTDATPYNNTSGEGVVIQDGLIAAARSGASVIAANRMTSEGPIINLNYAGGNIGNIGVVGTNNVYINGDNVGLGIGDDNLYPTDASGSSTTGALDLGDSTAQFRHLYLSGNITVGGTVDGRDLASDGTKLDGIESGATGDQTASEILTAIKTVDGSTSGLDADLLDGVHGSSFLRSDASDTMSQLLTLSYNGTALLFNGGSETGVSYTPTESGSGQTRYFLRFDLTNNASYPFLTNRTPSGDVVIKTGSAAGGSENEIIRFNGGDGVRAIDISNGNLNISSGTTQPLKLTTSSSGPWAIELYRSDTSFSSKVYNNGSGWYFEHTPYVGSNSNNVWHAGNDGASSGLDADLLDGQHGSYYTSYTDTAISNLVASAPSTLDTLNELAAALGDDANFSTTVTNSIATKLPLAGGTMSGTLVVGQIDSGNPSAGTDDIRVSGYGILGNRGTFYVTNPGTVQIGVGSIHNADPAMSFTSSQNTSHHTLYEGSNRVFNDGYHPNADKWTTARTLSLSGDASGSVSWDGSANATLSVSVGDADTVDGIQGASFLRSDANDTATGTITFAPTGATGQTYFGSATQTNYMNLVITSNSGNAQIWKSGTGYSGFGGTSSLNIYNSNSNISFFSNGRTSYDMQISGGDVDIAGSLTTEGPDGGAFVGTWPGNSDFAMFGTANMTGSEYAVITDGTNTYVSAGSGGSATIRGGSNDSDPQIEVRTDAINIRRVTTTGPDNLYLKFIDTSTEHGVIGTSYNDDLFIASTGKMGMRFGSDAVGFGNDTGTIVNNAYDLGYNSYRVRSGYFGTDVRAPIFYDIDNTAYYTNPASNSNFYTIQERDGGEGYIEGGSSGTYYYHRWGVTIGSTASGYKSIAINGGKYKYFELEANVRGSGGANHQGFFWGNAVNNESISGNTSGYKTTHQNSTNFHIRSTYANSNQNTINPGFDPNDGVWHHQKITCTPDGYTRVYLDGNLVIETTGRIPSSPGYVGFINYAGTAQYNNIKFRALTDDYVDNVASHRSTVDMRAPIFYDSNDTAYYGDFASESRINSLRTAGYVVVGGTFQNNAYNSTTGAKLMFGGGNSDAVGNYYIGTNMENYGGNYNKLDLRWHTGIRMGAQQQYGGIRFYDSEDLGTVLFSIAKGGTSTRVESGNLHIHGADAPLNHAYLNIGYSGTGETRAIDIDGGWSGGENKSITFTHGSSSTDIVGQINCQHNGPGSRLRWGKLYHSGNSGAYTMELVSTSSSAADLSVTGNITASANVTAYSDESLKDNIEVIPHALDKVKDIRGVTFNRNDLDDNPRHTGVIAQEVEKVLPEVVSENEHGLKQVAYGNMVGLLIEAIKEQQTQIESQQEQINELKALLEK